MKCSFNQFVFLKCSPKMFLKPVANGNFVAVPFSCVINRQRTPWQYAFVNKDSKMYKMVFTSENEFIDAIFDAKEIWYGPLKYSNELFNKRDEMLLKYDLENNEV